MKNKVLKNIPKPDADKLAIFYGRENKMSTVDEVSTVDQKTTVDKMSTVDKKATATNETIINDKLKMSLTHSQQAVYTSLYNRSYTRNQDITDWVGYNELAKELNISSKTVQRSVDKLVLLHFIERVDIINTAQTKGSKYRLIQPSNIHLSTVDKMSTEDNKHLSTTK